MKNDVVARLASFGYMAVEGDSFALDFVIVKVENDIKSSCNISDIPMELRQVAIDMVCGEFLRGKKATGMLEGFDIEAAVKQIQEGDTNVTFAVGAGSMTPEQRLDTLINHLINGNRYQLTAFRRLKW